MKNEKVISWIAIEKFSPQVTTNAVACLFIDATQRVVVDDVDFYLGHFVRR